jgi:hypothetical protein
MERLAVISRGVWLRQPIKAGLRQPSSYPGRAITTRLELLCSSAARGLASGATIWAGRYDIPISKTRHAPAANHTPPSTPFLTAPDAKPGRPRAAPGSQRNAGRRAALAGGSRRLFRARNFEARFAKFARAKPAELAGAAPPPAEIGRNSGALQTAQGNRVRRGRENLSARARAFASLGGPVEVTKPGRIADCARAARAPGGTASPVWRARPSHTNPLPPSIPYRSNPTGNDVWKPGTPQGTQSLHAPHFILRRAHAFKILVRHSPPSLVNCLPTEHHPHPHRTPSAHVI